MVAQTEFIALTQVQCLERADPAEKTNGNGPPSLSSENIFLCKLASEIK